MSASQFWAEVGVQMVSFMLWKKLIFFDKMCVTFGSLQKQRDVYQTFHWGLPVGERYTVRNIVIIWIGFFFFVGHFQQQLSGCHIRYIVLILAFWGHHELNVFTSFVTFIFAICSHHMFVLFTVFIKLVLAILFHHTYIF